MLVVDWLNAWNYYRGDVVKRQDINCFCGGSLIKGRTVCWVCASCGEQWWPNLWDKLQTANNTIKKLETELRELKKEVNP